MIANLIIVTISNIFSRLNTWKPTEAVAALALGYPYDIDDTEE